jgi:flagellar basal-body rod modification protein FlgD
MTTTTAAASGTASAIDGLALPTYAGRPRRTELGQDAFLQLMVTQLQNQDPTKPLEANEFVGQLAQFSSVASLADVSRSVGQLSDAIYANQAVQASGLIGRTVLVGGNTGTLAAGQPLAGGVELPFATSRAVVRVFNGAGEVVRQLPLGSQNAGLARFAWDGRDSTGAALPPGTYRFAAAILPQAGQAERAIDTYAATRVTSVALSTDLASSRITTESGQDLRIAQIKAIQ